MLKKIKFIDEVSLENKTILLRVDFNIAFEEGSEIRITDDTRIRQVLPTISLLQKNGNKLILVSHLSNPKTRDAKYSLKIVLKRLQELMPATTFTLLDNFESEEGRKILSSQKKNEIILLENIRFHEGERENDLEFAKQLSRIADVYVNDAFAVSHRKEASIVKVPSLIPSFGGLLLKKEAKTITEVLENGERPFVAIVGGAKIGTKIDLIERLIGTVDYILVGGGVANTLLCAEGFKIQDSRCEFEKMQNTKGLVALAKERGTTFVLPTDVVTAKSPKEKKGSIEQVQNISNGSQILDIGPETQKKFCGIIAEAKTIVWNGPVGYFENPEFSKGTSAIYEAIAHNENAVSIIGGGETLSSISKKKFEDKGMHLSTGGGAMLEYIQNGSLPGIWALAHESIT